MIQTTGLSRNFGDFVAVHDLNLHVPKGVIFGFLGPNGSGKSTTVKMLTGILRPTADAFANRFNDAALLRAVHCFTPLVRPCPRERSSGQDYRICRISMMSALVNLEKPVILSKIM